MCQTFFPEPNELASTQAHTVLDRCPLPLHHPLHTAQALRTPIPADTTLRLADHFPRGQQGAQWGSLIPQHGAQGRGGVGGRLLDGARLPPAPPAAAAARLRAEATSRPPALQAVYPHSGDEEEYEVSLLRSAAEASLVLDALASEWPPANTASGAA